MEKSITFTYIKPGATLYSAEIIDIIKKKGFTVILMKPFLFTEIIASEFYSELAQRISLHQRLVEFTCKEPVLVMILEFEGDGAISSFRELIGATDPGKADQGTIRNLFGDAADYMNGIPANAIHGSDSTASVIREIKLIFPEFNISPYLVP
jgi:nucleoside-diphosphate kinase